MRAAQVAHEAAEQAHAAVQMVLADLEAASAHPVRDPHAVPERDSADTPQSSHLLSSRAGDNLNATDGDWASMAIAEFHPSGAGPFELPDSPTSVRTAAPSATLAAQSNPAPQDQPLHANLIQFPREVVATRRLRPRLAESPLAALESAPQLSIFEVDPAAISTEPAAPVVDEPAAPTWMRPEWPAVELESQPQQDLVDERALRQHAHSAVVDLAPLSKRLMSIAIDSGLTLAAFACVVAFAARIGAVLHSPRAFEIFAAVILILACAGYQTLCFYHARATLGMMYAGIALCTVDGYKPTREQRLRRLLKLPLSVLPLGLGLAWSVFDEDRLTWHDRLSGTYLRECSR